MANVLVKVKSSGSTRVFKKCMIRDRTFVEIDTSCKKVSGGNLKASEVEGVISFKEGKFQVVPTNEWLDTAQAASFWE